MIAAVADTHSVIWFLSQDRRLSHDAQAFMSNSATSGMKIGVASITLVEMVYLLEKGRIPADRFAQLMAALQQSENLLVEIPLGLEVAQAVARVPRNQVPDMPDRIIAATAVYLGVPLISRDARIQLSAVPTIW